MNAEKRKNAIAIADDGVFSTKNGTKKYCIIQNNKWKCDDT